jgi:hypothetical protein
MSKREVSKEHWDRLYDQVCRGTELKGVALYPVTDGKYYVMDTAGKNYCARCDSYFSTACSKCEEFYEKQE